MAPSRLRRRWGPALMLAAGLLAACGGPVQSAPVTLTRLTTVPPAGSAAVATATLSAAPSPERSRSQAATAAPRPVTTPGPGTTRSPARPSGTFTFAFAGDVNFMERTAERLAANPATAFGVAAGQLRGADLTMMNLETSITTRGEQQPKSFTFRAPATALTALADAGVDVVTMANNHAADYGRTGLDDTLAAMSRSPVPVIGIGSDENHAFAPFRRTVNGVPIAVFAASQVQDLTKERWSATADSPGIANADRQRLVDAVKAARAAGDVPIVYLHWGTEYQGCPNSDQRRLADQLAAAGAAAVIGTHAHVLQGAGWRPDGVYVAYGLSNYLWWRSFGNEQDDNGVLTLTFTGRKVTAASFVPAHLDGTGVPVPAVGATRSRIDAEWDQVRRCADLSAEPPR